MTIIILNIKELPINKNYTLLLFMHAIDFIGFLSLFILSTKIGRYQKFIDYFNMISDTIIEQAPAIRGTRNFRLRPSKYMSWFFINISFKIS